MQRNIEPLQTAPLSYGKSATRAAVTRPAPRKKMQVLQVTALRNEGTKVPSPHPSRATASEPRDRGQAHRAGLARRDVVVAVGGRPITLVEDVLDVELHAPHLVDLGVNS